MDEARESFTGGRLLLPGEPKERPGKQVLKINHQYMAQFLAQFLANTAVDILLVILIDEMDVIL